MFPRVDTLYTDGVRGQRPHSQQKCCLHPSEIGLVVCPLLITAATQRTSSEPLGAA